MWTTAGCSPLSQVTPQCVWGQGCWGSKFHPRHLPASETLTGWGFLGELQLARAVCPDTAVPRGSQVLSVGHSSISSIGLGVGEGLCVFACSVLPQRSRGDRSCMRGEHRVQDKRGHWAAGELCGSAQGTL